MKLNAREPTRRWSLFFAIALAILLSAACTPAPRIEIVAPDGHRRAAVKVEIADTPSARETGLMYRDRLSSDAGMIFVFKAPDQLSFWMKNTKIPLDMIFADGGGRVVGIVANAEPYSETPRGVGADSQYVLEVNGGFAASHHIEPGDRMVFIGFAPHARN